MFENRTWSGVGGPGFSSMPYLNALAKQCSYFNNWTETNPAQSSLTQYIGLTSGVNNPKTVNDCSPGGACLSTDNNIFRQVRGAGLVARSYVEGATTGCSASGNSDKHIPQLYYRGANDFSFCAREVRPYSEMNPNNLPAYAMVTPTPCHDGHDCPNRSVDGWAAVNIQRVLNGTNYRSGDTAVFVIYDEAHPVPNLIVAPTARRGPIGTPASHAAALRTFEALLGLAALPSVAAVPSLRIASNT